MLAQLPAGLREAGSEFRSKPVTRELLESADLVLTAEASHRQWILDDHPGLFKKVLTLGQAAAALESAPSDIDRAGVLSYLATHRGSAGGITDVADPYRRGTEAAQICAKQITALVEAVIPRLA